MYSPTLPCIFTIQPELPMKLIQPPAIVNQIQRIIEEATDKVILVTENFSPASHNLFHSIREIKKKQIDLICFVKSDNLEAMHKNWLEIEPVPIDYLHVNIFLNESQGLISSLSLQNLNQDSVEIAYLTETQHEYQELFQFYVSFINNRIQDSVGSLLLEENIVKEKILLEYINIPEFAEVSKIYHPASTIIKSYGAMINGLKTSRWLEWAENGKLIRDSFYEKDVLVKENPVHLSQAEHLFFCLLTAGIYRISVADLRPDTLLSEVVGSNRFPLFNHLQEVFKIRLPNCVLQTFGDVTEVVGKLLPQPSKNILRFQSC